MADWHRRMPCWICIVSLLRCLSILLPSGSVTGLVSFVPTIHTNYNTQRRRRRQGKLGKSSNIWSSRRLQEDATNDQQQQPTIIVVGKIIVDEYGDPNNNKSPTITVGGGGPQAAMGAALALAARSLYDDDVDEAEEWDMDYKKSYPAPKQPVAFMAAVGDLDFTNVEEESLMQILSPALLYNPRILRGQDLMTPRIRLWHDDNQVLQWFALNDSFGPAGAGGLWGQLPTVEDYLSLLDDIKSQEGQQQQQPHEVKYVKPILYVISECGKDAPGNNGDSRPLLDSRLRNAISYLGVEPILFPQQNGEFCKDNANHCATLLQGILDATPPTNKHADDDNTNGSPLPLPPPPPPPPPPPVVISPDMAAFTALQECTKRNPSTTTCMSSCDLTWAVRHGPNGSQIIQTSTTTSSPKDTAVPNDNILKIPAATLNQLVNPTGAGNAFAAAYTALRGSGCNCTMSACLATGVGAVFCEYTHCPPYTSEVIQRVVEASREVRLKLLKQ